MRLLLARIQRLANFFRPSHPRLQCLVQLVWDFGLHLPFPAVQTLRACSDFVLANSRNTSSRRIFEHLISKKSGPELAWNTSRFQLVQNFPIRSHHALRTTRKSYLWISVHPLFIFIVFVINLCYKYFYYIFLPLASWPKDTIINLSARMGLRPTLPQAVACNIRGLRVRACVCRSAVP